MRDHLIDFDETRGNYLLSCKEYRIWDEKVGEVEAEPGERELA